MAARASNRGQMKTQLTEQSEVSCMSEFNPALISRYNAPKHEISAGFNSHSDLCSLSFHKSRAH